MISDQGEKGGLFVPRNKQEVCAFGGMFLHRVKGEGMEMEVEVEVE
jgi:hypothetical protein